MSVIHATATTMTLAKSKINDDKMEIENWFKGFEKGLERLSPEQRSVFFSECGRNCVNGGTLSVYQQLYERAQGDMVLRLAIDYAQQELGAKRITLGVFSTNAVNYCLSQQFLQTLGLNLIKIPAFGPKVCIFFC